ncbi:Protein of unknown function [Bacillus mycoides]|nr:Protein of unknown function [Bacillus mycoides]SCM91370.1 Protein of unknown function [Bacillus mycoides]
MGMELVVSNC